KRIPLFLPGFGTAVDVRLDNVAGFEEIGLQNRDVYGVSKTHRRRRLRGGVHVRLGVSRAAIAHDLQHGLGSQRPTMVIVGFESGTQARFHWPFHSTTPRCPWRSHRL